MFSECTWTWVKAVSSDSCCYGCSVCDRPVRFAFAILTGEYNFIWGGRALRTQKDVLRDVWHQSECILSLPFSLFVWQKCLELKSSLLAQQKGTQSSLERLRTLIRLIQNEQMIQVTMTTTTTSSLLTMPWIKPSSASAAMHQTLQHSQGHNWPGRHRTAMEGGQTLHPGTKRKGTDTEGKSGLGVYTHCNLQARRSHL